MRAMAASSIVLLLLGCGWERTNPFDPERCSAPCGGGMICFEGKCQASDARVLPDVSGKADVRAPDVTADVAATDAAPDAMTSDGASDAAVSDATVSDGTDATTQDAATQPDAVTEDAPSDAADDATSPSPWSVMDSKTTKDLRGVWGTSDSNVFAVGLDGTILRFSGTTWAPMTSNTTQPLVDVWGVSSSEVYAVGTTIPGHEEGIIKYNGSGWAPVTTGHDSHLEGVCGTGSGDIWAGRPDGELLHFNGVGWSRVVTGTVWAITGLYCLPGQVWAGTANGEVHTSTNGGQSWTSLPTSGSGGITDLWATGSVNVYATGDKVLRYTGSWTNLNAPTGGHSVDGTADELFVVTNQILRYASGSWEVEEKPAPGILYGVWYAPSGVVFAVGNNGVILRREPTPP